MIKGFTVYEPRLSQQGLHDLQKTVHLLQKTLTHNGLVNDIGTEVIQIILSYAKTWNLLLAYDEDRLKLQRVNSSWMVCDFSWAMPGLDFL